MKKRNNEKNKKIKFKMKLLQDGEETGDVEENERYERCLLNSKEGESR